MSVGYVRSFLCSTDYFDFFKKHINYIRDEVTIKTFIIASYLTDPVSKSHECFRSIYVVDNLFPKAAKVTNFARKYFLFLKMLSFAGVAIFTTIPAVFLRVIGCYIRSKSFIYKKQEYKTFLKRNRFSMLSWNVCMIGGGYSISDGGVVPWHMRIDKIVDKMIQIDADVVCLFEVFDINSSLHIYDRLKKVGYINFVFNISAQALGVNAGIFIASKYEIQNPFYEKFSKDILVGRTKNAAKGVFNFDLKISKKTIKIYATHLQHSEKPAFPTKEEIETRKKQMEIIFNKIDSLENLQSQRVIVTGDLNLDDDEYQKLNGKQFFKKKCKYKKEKTWGGDSFCAKLVGKAASKPLNLDHTMIFDNDKLNIKTYLRKTGYNPEKFLKKALSDHKGLYSEIEILG